jgi:hypothetical protein
MSGNESFGHDHAGSEYMPMTHLEFTGTDPNALPSSDLAGRVRYYKTKLRMVRDRNEPEDARAYFDNIQGAYEEALEMITPDTLGDPAKMNSIVCVDPNTYKQLEELPFSEQERAKAPAGLGFFDQLGILDEWIAARIFNPRLAAGLHPNCGGMAILGALTGERQAMMRDRAEANARRTLAETAAQARQQYILRKGHRFDPQGVEALTGFTGPEFTIAMGDGGSAAPFVTPKSHHVRPIEIYFTPSELLDNMDKIIDQRVKDAQADGGSHE